MLRSDPDPAGRLCISYAEFVEAYAAMAFANCQGYFVDASLDITWSLHGINAEATVAERHNMLLTAIAAWQKAVGLPPFYVWVLERGDTRGPHSHITLHLPPDREDAFRTFLDEEIARLVAGPVIMTGRSRTYMLQTFGSETTQHQWRRFRYMLKALDPEIDLTGNATDDLAVSLARIAKIEPKISGRLNVPRVGVASALSGIARATWQARYPLPQLTIDHQHPPRFKDQFLEWYEEHVDTLKLGGPGRRLTLHWPFLN